MSILADLYKKYGKGVITSSEDISNLIEPYRRKDEGIRIIMIGGSEKYQGALLMSGLAALRTGVHGVVLVAPECVCKNASIVSPSGFVTLKTNDSFIVSDEIKKMASKWELRALIGPGIEKNGKTEKYIVDIINFFIRKKIPTVIDANALDIIVETGLIKKLKNEKIILIPNDKELKLISRYYGLQVPESFLEKVKFVQELSKKIGLTICAKGRRDIITDGQRIKINYAGDPIMSAANCGDVLSGLLVSFLAETKDLFSACIAGAFLVGRAGNLSFSKYGYSFVAYDLLGGISEFIRMASAQTLIDEVRLSKNTFKEGDLEI